MLNESRDLLCFIQSWATRKEVNESLSCIILKAEMLSSWMKPTEIIVMMISFLS